MKFFEKLVLVRESPTYSPCATLLRVEATQRLSLPLRCARVRTVLTNVQVNDESVLDVLLLTQIMA